MPADSGDEPATAVPARQLAGRTPVSAELPNSPRAARAAHTLIRRTCTAWRLPRLCGDAELVATELVTNAVRHAGTPVTVTVHPLPDGPQIEVTDHSTRPISRRDPTPDEDGGRGLFLVDALAARWHVDADPHGKRVTADLLDPHSRKDNPIVDTAPIRARLDAITPGPWTRHGADIHTENQPTPLLRGRDGDPDVRGQADADAEFVAHAPADLAALLTALAATDPLR